MRKKKAKNTAGTTLETMIGAGTSVKGDITFEGGLRVDGHVEGTITAPDGSGSRLVITDQAEVHGEVQVPNVVINGRMYGNVHASERLELHTQSSVEGDLYYEIIQMEEGADIMGTCSHVSATKAKSADAASAAQLQEAAGGDKLDNGSEKDWSSTDREAVSASSESGSTKTT